MNQSSSKTYLSRVLVTFHQTSPGGILEPAIATLLAYSNHSEIHPSELVRQAVKDNRRSSTRALSALLAATYPSDSPRGFNRGGDRVFSLWYDGPTETCVEKRLAVVVGGRGLVTKALGTGKRRRALRGVIDKQRIALHL
jgi:hypothetical protein